MSRTVPAPLEWLWDLLIMATSFQEWPEGDPDAWRDLGDTWQDLSDAIRDAYMDMGQNATDVAFAWGGAAGTAFNRRWIDFVNQEDSGPAGFSSAAAQYRAACYEGAMNLEFSQLMCEIILEITAVEVAIGLAFSEFGGEAYSAAAVGIGQVAVRTVLNRLAAVLSKQFLKAALKDAAKIATKQGARAAFRGAARAGLRGGLRAGLAGLRAGATFGAADWLAQQYQISAGTRRPDQFSWDSVRNDAIGGTVAGVVGHLSGNFLGGGLRRFGVNPAGRVGRWAVGTATGALTNVPTMAALDITNHYLATGQLGFSNRFADAWTGHGLLGGLGELGSELLAGGIGGGVRGAADHGLHSLVDAGRRATGTDVSHWQGWTDRAAHQASLRDDALARGADATRYADRLRDLEAGVRQQAATLTDPVARQDAVHAADRLSRAALDADTEARVQAIRADNFHRLSALSTQHADAVAPAESRRPVDAPLIGAGVHPDEPRAGGVRIAAHADGPAPAAETSRTEGTAAGRPVVRDAAPHGVPEAAGPRPDPPVPPEHDAVPADRDAVRVAGPVPEHGAGDPVPEADRDAAPVAAPVLVALHDLGQAHDAYAGARADTVTTQRLLDRVEDAQTRATLRGLRPRLFGLGEPAAEALRDERARLADTATALRGALDERLATAAGLRDAAVERLDGLLARDDLPEPVRQDLERMRAAYQEEAAGRAAADAQALVVLEGQRQALRQHLAGDPDAALTHVRRSVDAAGDAARQRVQAGAALGRATAVLHALPETRPADGRTGGPRTGRPLVRHEGPVPAAAGDPPRDELVPVALGGGGPDVGTMPDRPDVPDPYRGLSGEAEPVRTRFEQIFAEIDRAGVDADTRRYAKAQLREDFERSAAYAFRSANGHLTVAQARENAAARADRAFQKAGRAGLDRAVQRYADDYYRASGLRSWDVEHAWRTAHPEQAGRVDAIRRAATAALHDLDRLSTERSSDLSAAIGETRAALDGYVKGLQKQIDKVPEQGGLNETAVDGIRNGLQHTLREIELARASDAVSGLNVLIEAPGTDPVTGEPVTVRSEMDVVTHDGRVWKDSKDYQHAGFDTTGTEWNGKDGSKGLRREALDQLHIASHGGYRAADGTPPVIEWHFWNGVHPEIRAALETLRPVQPRFDAAGNRMADPHIRVVDRAAGEHGYGEPGDRPADPAEPDGSGDAGEHGAGPDHEAGRTREGLTPDGDDRGRGAGADSEVGRYPLPDAGAGDRDHGEPDAAGTRDGARGPVLVGDTAAIGATALPRYRLELPEDRYAVEAQRALDDLAERGYQPVRLDDGWTAERGGGLVSRWRDPQTGREFDVRLDTARSWASDAALRDWQAARRAHAEPAHQRELAQRYQAMRDQVRMPAGVDRVHLPGAAADLGGGTTHATVDQRLEQLPLVHGADATRAVQDTVRDIRSGVDFTGSADLGRMLDRLAPEAGVVKVALHGLRDGTVVVGDVRMSHADFVEGLKELVRDGRIELDGNRVRLLSCYSGRGDESLAARVARELGVEVTGGTDRVWVYPDGTERVSSADHDRPTEPADGAWRTFGPDGREVAGRPGDARPAPVLHRSPDGRLRAPGDPPDRYRDPDGRLHAVGDRPGTYRDDATGRLHHDTDGPGTYRGERHFRLMSSDGRPVPDPLAGRTQPVTYHAVEGPREPHQASAAVADRARELDAAVAARDDFAAGTLQPLLDSVGLADRPTDTELRRLRVEGAGNQYAQLRVRAVERALHIDRANRLAVRAAAADLRREAAADVLAQRYGIAGDRVLADGADARRGGEFAVAGFDPDGHRLVVLETGRVRGSSHLLGDGTRTERGTPRHLREVLATSPRLHERLRERPHLLDELHRALRRGDLRVEYHHLEVGGGRVSTRPFDLHGLDLHGLAEHLPHPSGTADARAAARLAEAAGRVAGLVHATVPDPATVEVTPPTGRPYRAELVVADLPGDRAFQVTLGDAGTHRIEVSRAELDRADRAGLDRLAVRALGHLGGEVAAAEGGRLGRFFGRRLARADALAVDPAPRRRLRMSHADLAHTAEFDALARLHEGSAAPARDGLERELGQFIEQHGLRDGVPGAQVRADLMRGRLSETGRRALDEQRVWWRDSEPAVAGVRRAVQHAAVPARITPVPARGAIHFEVTPEGWRGSDRVGFTFEVRAGEVARGGPVEFAGTKEDRHFILRVDPDRFDLAALTGPDRDAAGYRLGQQLKRVLAAQIDAQVGRPGERPPTRRDVLLRELPTGAGAGSMFEIAHLLHAELLTTKGLVTAGIDLVTLDRLHRMVTLEQASAAHERALADTPDAAGVSRDRLQRGIDASFAKAADLARDAFGDPALVDRRVAPGPDRAADGRRPLDAADGRRPLGASGDAVRERTRDTLAALNRARRSEPVEHLLKINERRDGSYRLRVKGPGNDAILRVEAGTTAGIEVEYTGRNRATLWVPKELERAAPDEFRSAVRDAVADVVRRQYEVNRNEIGLGQRLEEGFIGEVQQDLMLYPAAENLAPHLGEVIAPAGAVRAAVQAVTDRILGQRDLELADRRARWDEEHSTRFTGDERRNLANQVVDLAENGQVVAQRLLELADRTATPVSGAPPAGRVAGHAAAVTAVRDAMEAVNDRHGARFKLSAARFDSAGRLTRATYRSNEAGIKYDVELRLRFTRLDDGRAVVPSGTRVSRGTFEFLVNEDASPERIAETLGHVADNVMWDREHRVPLRRRLYEDAMPAALRVGTAAGVGALSPAHQLAAGTLAGVGAGAHLASRWIGRLHQLRMNDIELNKTLAGTHAEDVPPALLRESLAAQRTPVERLEARVRDLEDQLAAASGSADRIADLRTRLGTLPAADATLLPALAERVGHLTDLPRGARITAVADAPNTFRVTYRGASGRPESLTFEVGTGHTGGAPLRAHRVDSDVTHALRVDPTRPAGEVADHVRRWLVDELHRASHAPSGLPGAKGRLLSFARDATGQVVASGASLAIGKHPKLAEDVVAQAAWATNATAGSAAREVTDASLAAHEAVSAATRQEQVLRHFGTASEEQLALAADDADHLMDRVWHAYERLHHLEQIADALPPDERPAPLRAGHLTPPREPVSLGGPDPQAHAAAEAALRRSAGHQVRGSLRELMAAFAAGVPDDVALVRAIELEYGPDGPVASVRVEAGPGGAAGTAARLMTAFHRLEVPGVQPEHFARAVVQWLAGAGGHPVAEVLHGIRLAAPDLPTDRLLDGLAPVPAGASTHLLGYAGALRSDAGLVDDAALHDFLGRLPRVPAMGGDRAALRDFAADVLARDPAGLVLDPVTGEGGAKGVSGAPVFWVRDAAGARVAVLKVFSDAREFAREAAALDRLHAEGFDRLAAPEVFGLGVAGAGGVLVSEVARGRPLDEALTAARDAAPGGRDRAVAEALRAFRDTGAALAELHSRPGGAVADWFADRSPTTWVVEAVGTVAGDERFQRYLGFDGRAVTERFTELLDAVRRDPGPAGLLHGDAHPGNFLHDPATGRVTLIDVEGMYASMDARGVPVGPAAVDLGFFAGDLSGFAHDLGVAPLLPALRAALHDGYAEAGGPALPRHVLDLYRAGGVALALEETRQALFGEVRPDVPRVADLTRRAREQLGELHEALGLPFSDGDRWAHAGPPVRHAAPSPLDEALRRMPAAVGPDPSRIPARYTAGEPPEGTTPLLDRYRGEDRINLIAAALSPDLPRDHPLLTERPSAWYMDEAERERYRLVVLDGRLYTTDGDLFDTRAAGPVSFPEAHQAMFVVDEHGNLYAAQPTRAGMKHSSFLAGAPVAAAGMIEVHDGRIRLVNPKSGHYRPEARYVRQFVELMRGSGADLSAARVQETFGGPEVPLAPVPAPPVPPDIVVHQPALPRPDQTTGPIGYGRALDRLGQPTPLFDGPPVRDQVRQGYLGDCYAVAVIGAVAGHHPDAITAAVRENPDGTYRVRLHETRLAAGRTRAEPTGRTIEIDVSPEVPTSAHRPDRSLYMDQSRNGSAWAGVLEKAIAGVDDTWPLARRLMAGHSGYERLDRGGFAVDEAELLTQLTGRVAVVEPVDTSPVVMEAAWRRCLDDGRPVLISFDEPPKRVQMPYDLVGGHVYELVGLDGQGRVHLRNPWGQDHPVPVTVRELLAVRELDNRYVTLEPAGPVVHAEGGPPGSGGSRHSDRSVTRDEAPRHADSAGGGIQKAGLHLATGAREGEPPTPRSIEQGTVRMEEHPEYEQVVNELHRAGYVVVHTEHDPHVVVRCVVDRQGKVLKTEHEVRVKPGMRFLDLEHELGHVRQLTDPARFPDGPPCTQYVFERPNGVRIKAKLHGPELKTWQDASIEYHVRLQELLRLSARGVDREVLEEHAEGVLKWKATFQKETHRNGESTMRSAWSRRHFPDIPELARQVFSDTDLFPRGAVDQQLFHGPEPIGGQDAPE